jgi:hypothetical protein
MHVTKAGLPEGDDRARRQPSRAESLVQEESTEQRGEYHTGLPQGRDRPHGTDTGRPDHDRIIEFP